eukprot:GFUD01033198.1.p1 GENE.GFUD01033198.1~~GFUD01033198.1.p1  ORF type:complete len:1313 (+),score=556.33 GFUD01033198.1:149-4087(+)
MAQIKKLQVQGIRSFGPEADDRQNIEFFSPLTLILGQNGCGKTTIIECLKYVTTGDVPPGSGRGQSFVHDPKMAREASVKGQVKLSFHGVGNTLKVISRSMEASQKLKNITIKTLDSTISTKNPHTGEQTQLSSKCADINAEMLNCLGVSRPILNYVIFCHQEDSNWPLEEGSKVKDKFDEIFNSAKYKNCLKNIKDVRKGEMEKVKIDKNNMEHYKSDKEYSDSKNKDLKRKKAELEKMEETVEKITKDLEPLREALSQVMEEEKGYSEIQKKLAEAQTSLDHCKKEIVVLENQISEVLPDTEDEEDLIRSRDGIEKETKAKEKELKELTKVVENTDNSLARGEKQVQKNAALIGKAVGEKDQHLKDVKQRENLAENAINELDLIDDAGDITEALKKEELKLKNQVKLLKAENKNKENTIEEEIDQLKSKKTGLEEGKKREQADMMGSKKEIAQLKRQLNDLEGAAEQLVKIKNDWEAGAKQLEMEKNKVDIKVLQEEISQEKVMVKELEVNERKLRDEYKSLEEKQSILQKIAHLTEDMESKESKLKKIMNKRNSDFIQLFDVVPDTKRLKVTWKDGQEIADKKLKELESDRKKVENELNAKTISKKDAKKSLEKKSSRKQHLEATVGDILGPDDDLEEEISSTQESLELSRKELAVKEAGKFTYREMIDRMKAMGKDVACPTCNRAFHAKHEAQELATELEDIIKSIPNKVKNLESKVKKLSARLEQLQKIRPEVHELKSIRKEVEDSASNLEELDRDMKKMREDLDEGEEDWNMTELNVSLYRQVGEDVQLADSLAREVAQLREKKEEIGLQVEGGGGRSLDVVRREDEEVGSKLRIARKNLEQCQETVNKQSGLINELEARQNRLTNRKLEIDGQQQQRANMVTKREELEGKVEKAGEEVKRCTRELEPIREQLEETENKKRKLMRDGEKMVECIVERERKLERFSGDIQRLDTVLSTYADGDKDEHLERLKKDKVDLEEKMSELKDEKRQTEERASKLKVEVSNQESRRRLFDDNLRLRDYKNKEGKYERTVRSQEKALDDMDWRKVEKKKNDLSIQYNKLSAEKSAKGGQMAEVVRSVKDMERELAQPKLKDAAAKYKEMAIKHKLRTKVAEDLNKYYIALDFAIMKYHKEKMKVVNKIVRELWRNTYRGNDIDYIEIKTTEDSEVSSGADKKKTYNYRVVMVKNDTEMDMRGRCSAGQKVLSSLIIRLALAETFSTNCGIIALDEPTTNLDRENIESLALALADIAIKRAAQKNFQLVVITHDEEFIEQLSRCDQIQHYQKVSRNARGLSEVRKMNVANLEQET